MGIVNYFRYSWHPTSASNNTRRSPPTPIVLHMNQLQVRNNPGKRRFDFCKKWTFWILIFTILAFITSVTLFIYLKSNKHQDGSEELDCAKALAENDSTILSNGTHCRPNYVNLTLSANVSKSDQIEINHSISKSCSFSQFMCPESGICIQKSKICDKIQDCNGGEDEKNCITLSKSVFQFDYESNQNLTEGYLLTRIKGVWHPYCSAEWSGALGNQICEYLGHLGLKDLKPLDLYSYGTKKFRGNRSAEIIENSIQKVQLIEIASKDGLEKLPSIIEVEVMKNQTSESLCQIGYLICN